MAKLHGKTGAIYRAAGYINGTTLSFEAASKIHDSADGFVSTGFIAAQKIVVTGSSLNSATYTIAGGGVVASTLTTTSGAILTEAAGEDVTIVVAAPGTLSAGFASWTADNGIDAEDTTDFADGANGIHGFTTGLKNWTATAERFIQSGSDTLDSWVGSHRFIRLFVKYVAIPSAGDPAYYYEGLALVTKITPNVKADAVTKQTFLAFETNE